MSAGDHSGDHDAVPNEQDAVSGEQDATSAEQDTTLAEQDPAPTELAADAETKPEEELKKFFIYKVTCNLCGPMAVAVELGDELVKMERCTVCAPDNYGYLSRVELVNKNHAILARDAESAMRKMTDIAEMVRSMKANIQHMHGQLRRLENAAAYIGTVLNIEHGVPGEGAMFDEDGSVESDEAFTF